MLEEGNDLNNDMNNLNPETPETPPPEESNNRAFFIVGGIFAVLILLTLACGAGYVFWLGPRLNAQKSSAQATVEAQNAQVVQQMTSTAEASLWTPTLPPTSTPTNTAIPTIPIASATPVVAMNTAVYTSTPTTDPATLIAMQTQLAAQLTSTAIVNGTHTPAMPTTGFFDQVGLPTLIVLTGALVVVIFLARSLRRAPLK